MLRQRYTRLGQDDTPTRTERKVDDEDDPERVLETAFTLRVQFTVVMAMLMLGIGHFVMTGTFWWPVLIPSAICLVLHCGALYLLGPRRSPQIYLALMILPAFVITPLCLAMPSEEFFTAHEEAKDGTGTLVIFFSLGVGHAVNLRSTTWKVLGGATFVASRLAGELLLERTHSYQSFTLFYVLHGHLPFVVGALFGQLITYTLVDLISPLRASLREAKLRNGELEQARQDALIREFQRTSASMHTARGGEDERVSRQSCSSEDSASLASHYTTKVDTDKFVPEAEFQRLSSR